MPEWFRTDREYEVFCEGDRIIPARQTMYRKDLGKTLGLIAEHGAGAFYDGEIAHGLVEAVQARQGVMTLEDLRGEAC